MLSLIASTAFQFRSFMARKILSVGSLLSSFVAKARGGFSDVGSFLAGINWRRARRGLLDLAAVIAAFAAVLALFL